MQDPNEIKPIRELVIMGARRTGMSLFAATRDLRAEVVITSDEVGAPLPVITIDSLSHARKKLMNPNAHEVPLAERLDLPTEVHDADYWDSTDWPEPVQDDSYGDFRKERIGNNKFKPTKEHKRRIKKLANKAKQKQRRLKGK